MKPDYRSTAYPLSRAASNALAQAREQTLPPNAVQRIRARFAAWWRERQQKREEQIRVEALAPLGKHLLQDLGVSEELRSRALAQRESHYERATEPGAARGFTARFGPW